MEERRQTRRSLTSIFIRFSCGSRDDQTYEAFTEDVSLEGVRMLTNFRPHFNDDLKLNIDVPNNPDMTVAEGNVRWVGEKSLKDDSGRQVFPIGVEITYIDGQDKAYLDKFLKVFSTA